MIELRIAGKKFAFWTQVTIARSLDGIDQFGFTTPMNTDNAEFRDIFRPFSFSPVDIRVDDELIFSGRIVTVQPGLEDNARTLSVAGYSLPGVLNDCTPSPISDREFNQSSLNAIASALCEPFGVFVEGTPPKVLKRVKVDAEEKVLPFLIKLAKQQGFFLTNTAAGFLKFIEPVKKAPPVARFVQGEPPLKGVSVNFDPQGYFSDITAMKPSTIDAGGEKYTTTNKRLSGILRPLAFIAGDTDKADLKKAAEAKMGRMFGNSVSYTIDIPTWRDSSGKLWKKNTFVNLLAPDVMIYKEHTFLVRAVEFSADNNSEGAVLTLVLPESFTDKIPERMPWD